MQSRFSSALEAFLNTASGFVISYLATFIVYPMFGAHFSAEQNFWIVTIFTVISVVRSYFWRRIFNHHLTKGA